MRKEQLTFLKEIAKLGSITAASEVMHITHQSLSTSVATLEQELGFRLLERTNQGAKLTIEAKFFIKYAEEFFNNIESVTLQKTHEKRKMRLFINREGAQYFLLSFIRELQDMHPELEFEIVFVSAKGEAETLDQNDADHLITIMPMYQNNRCVSLYRGAKSILLGQISHLCCLIPKALPIALYKKISLTTAASYPCIFMKNAYDDQGSIKFIVNQLAYFDDAIDVDNELEYKVKLLMGKRIGFEFINETSEWHSYGKFISIIPLKEEIYLQLHLIGAKNGISEDIIKLFENTSFEV